jgi:hypothetical protein
LLSASFQVRSGDLYTAASRTSILQIGMYTPGASTETRGGRSSWLWGMSFVTATAGPSFLPG